GTDAAMAFGAVVRNAAPAASIAATPAPTLIGNLLDMPLLWSNIAPGRYAPQPRARESAGTAASLASAGRHGKSETPCWFPPGPSSTGYRRQHMAHPWIDRRIALLQRRCRAADMSIQ